MLHLSGFIPTEPQQINFDMLFEKSDRWRLFGIAVNTSLAKGATSAVDASPAPKAPEAAKAGAASKN